MDSKAHVRFKTKYSVIDRGYSTACWIWVGRPGQDGYGKISVMGVTTRAHRWAWTIACGVIPPGVQVLHRCDVPMCVNPHHLFLGTVADNMHDKISKGRARAPVGEINGKAVLCEEQVHTIRVRLAAGGVLQRELAAEYGVARQTISKIATRRKWKALPDT